ncbi:hypothetical protein G6F70_002206 [Rhizopus microsporus]|uniref:Uncharacterized protein n=2 Tax=Rhizopus TaxID=4842 RepID=A0A0A1P8T5_RHIZD|nr:hypothetical protein G6F71_002281 [Rhizopus microsporus]KAG1202526.1 hypothetical protein G6F70_002206 [Rhizopus microsporus]KAG1213754.1 hypothetical protein G6F69_002553 [Rhizopus microsporus]KAG1235976.1 hypothetical protein G6F67_002360 [Rhizopus microsporus]KAG1264941.1 hypothetical protein G6F68_003980 [Rhizopus microsporus]
MKFSFVLLAALVISSVHAAESNTTVSNPLGGTAATASITVNNPNPGKSGAAQLSSGIALTTLASTAIAAYALF